MCLDIAGLYLSPDTAALYFLLNVVVLPNCSGGDIVQYCTGVQILQCNHNKARQCTAVVQGRMASNNTAGIALPSSSVENK